jgi:hypothetical protein
MLQEDRELRQVRERAAALMARGMGDGRARGVAMLEARIARWPAEWGDELAVLLHGGFAPCAEPLEFVSLGIRIEAGEVKGSVLKLAPRVLQAHVRVAERTVAGVIDAANRINALLDACAASGWGGASCGWWCHLTHGGASLEGAVAQRPPTAERVAQVLAATHNLPREVGRKVRAAMHWMREPGQLAGETYRTDVCRQYSACWNAFECLVEAVGLLKPPHLMTRQQRTQAIQLLVAERGGKLAPRDIAECYRRFVEPGLEGAAAHALAACFGEAAQAHEAECFRIRPERDRLHALCLAINRGDVDADSLEERLRVEDRLARLRTIVTGMLARLVPIEHAAAA